MCADGVDLCATGPAETMTDVWNHKEMPLKNTFIGGNRKFCLMKSYGGDEQSEWHFVNTGSSAG